MMIIDNDYQIHHGRVTLTGSCDNDSHLQRYSRQGSLPRGGGLAENG